MWVSGSEETPVVQYGTDANNLNLTSTGTSSTYELSDMCGASNYTWFSPGMISDVLLTLLIPSTPYFYRCYFLPSINSNKKSW